jgi:hypothetical protein
MNLTEFWQHWSAERYSANWIEDCLHWRGYLLTGDHGHWCEEWDGLPVDETCEEFVCCRAGLCYDA